MGVKHETLTADSYGSFSPRTIILRCTDRKFDAYILTDFVTDSQSVRVKYDNDKPARETWHASSDNKALFSEEPLWFVQNLVNTDELVFEYRPFEQIPTTLTFHTKGMPRSLSCLHFSEPDAKGNVKVTRGKMN